MQTFQEWLLEHDPDLCESKWLRAAALSLPLAAMLATGTARATIPKSHKPQPGAREVEVDDNRKKAMQTQLMAVRKQKVGAKYQRKQ